MKYLIKTGQVFFSLALIVYGAQQFYFGDFRNVFFSPYQKHLPFLNILAWLFGLYLIASGLLILLGKKGKIVSMVLGFVFLVLFFGTQIPYQLISEPNKIYHLGLWVNQLKELALAGGAFVVAGSFKEDAAKAGVVNALRAFVPYGNLLFLFTMTSFGIGHCIYAQHLAKSTVPGWFADTQFWVYFTGCALIGAGVAIILGIRIRAVALLLALMIFAWFWLVHIPGAIAHPVMDRGNLVASAFDALAFSGISLLIALTMKTQKWVADLENWNGKPLSTIK